MIVKCCRCGKKISSPSQTSVLMMSEYNDSNIRKIDFYACRFCYAYWLKIANERGLKKLLPFQFREAWAKLFFEDFLKNEKEKVEFT